MTKRPGRWALVRKEWQAVRHGVLERDNWCCQHCGARRRLEVHHVKRVADHPELAFDPSNCLVLCGPCHTKETNKELGRVPDPKRQAWRRAVAELAAKPIEHKGEINA
jgi:5-methylcytosine-specific restriction endonuclease McrA